MIRLFIRNYCQNCADFKARVDKDIMFDGLGNEYCETEITCKYKDRCDHIMEYLDSKKEKNE